MEEEESPTVILLLVSVMRRQRKRDTLGVDLQEAFGFKNRSGELIM